DSFIHITQHILLLLVTFALAGWSLTRVRQTAAQLFKQKELAEVTLHSIGDAVVTTDANGMVEYINPVAEELTGWKNENAQGRSITEICVLINGSSGEPEENPIEKCLRDKQVVGLAVNVVLKSRNGEDFVIEDSAAPIRDREGNIVGAVMVFYDVTLNRDGTHLLSYHATHDSLTGLVNRREFERRLLGLHERAKKLDLKHAFCYLDLDQFKIINDTCGHVVGDKLLRQLAYLLQENMRDSDTLARLGGDEFGILLENCPLERAVQIAEKMREVIREFRFTWEGKSYELGVSIGLVQIEKDSVSIHELMREADAACYAAKDKGRNRVQVYRPDNLELAKRHGEMQWVGRINEALV
ncbi:MAG TPA: diguanylate cyclase, partial [Gammaproteobacteria bacterium]|nr:diguanylate cyclase [Gammaproteobacteria bacterium]